MRIHTTIYKHLTGNMNLRHNPLMLQNNQYSSNVNDVLSGLRSTGHYADVTIVSDDQVSFLAHRFILSCWSPVLRNIIADHHAPYLTLYLVGIEHKEVESLLQLMYLGETLTDTKQYKELNDAALSLALDVSSRIEKEVEGIVEEEVATAREDASDVIPTFQCNECNQTFSRRKQKENHARKHKKAICGECGLPCLEQNLERHKKSCPRQRERRKNTGNNGKKISVSMSNTMANTETDNKTLQCHYKSCKFTSISNKLLTSHIVQEHLALKTKFKQTTEFPCILCNSFFEKADDMKNHMKDNHFNNLQKINKIN